MLARNYRRCSTLQNATGAFVGKVPAIGFHSVVGLRRVPPMSRRYPVEGAPGPSLLGTGEAGLRITAAGFCRLYQPCIRDEDIAPSPPTPILMGHVKNFSIVHDPLRNGHCATI